MNAVEIILLIVNNNKQIINNMEEGLLIHNSVFKDSRGTFAPLPLKFDESNLSVLRKDWVQSNISVNPKKFTFRGLHFQVGEFAQ